MKGLRVGLDATVTEIEFEPEHSLETKYEAIGCRVVECIALSPALDMWVDEEGGMVAEPQVNHMACYLASQFGRLGCPILGNVFLTGGPGPQGETTGLSGTAAAWVKEVLS